VIVKPILLLVDLQNDFLHGGKLEPHGAAVVSAATDLLNSWRAAGLPVIHVWSTVKKSADNRMPHWKKNDHHACLEGSAGHACPESLRPRKPETIIDKVFFSAFSTGQLEAVLRELKADAVIIAGVHLHACVRATALDAYAKNYAVVVAEDATGSNDPLHAAITKRYLEERCIMFRSSGEISVAVNSGAGQLEELLVDEERDVVTHSSPQNSERTWRLPAAQKTDVESAVTIARKAFSEWRCVPVGERLKLLQAFGLRLEKHADELVELLVSDIGKPIRYAHGEVVRARSLIEAAANQVEPAQDQVPQKTGYRREPHGVIGLIGPFNNPLAIPIGKIVPALLYGNAVVWKPAAAGSRIAQKTAEIFNAATGRSDVLQVLCGDEQTARAVMASSDAVTISGSLKAGWSAQEICAAHHIPLQAELGGNNASIVWRDADLAAAALSIAEGAFVFAGQRCTANRRAVIDATVYDSFLDQLIGATSRLVWGDPADEKTQVGPLISQASRNRVAAVIERARGSSLRVITPLGKSETLRGQAWLEPTIICCDDPNAEIVQEETFGPVLVVQRAENWDEAISLCNGVKQGLAAALFSTSGKLIEDFFRRARAGILKVNCSTADAAVDLPFGGWKASGIGPPEHGPANREFFTRMQSIYVS
jgi:acyl-CoA reductase-like NAD-dependent aldehyde dehydrogenase/nicotinamidase-related amidase